MISLHLSSVLASSPQCKLVLPNIDNYISNDAYMKISGVLNCPLAFYRKTHTFCKIHFPYLCLHMGSNSNSGLCKLLSNCAAPLSGQCTE